MDAKWHRAAAGVMASALLLAAPASAERMEQIRESGRIKIALYNDFAPYSCEARDGDLTGVDAVLARAVAQELGLQAELVGFGADDSMDADIQQLREDQEYDEWRNPDRRDRAPDLMMHVPVDPVFADRNPEFQFFAPYYHEDMAVLYDRDEIGDVPDVVNTPEPFEGSRIGVEMYTLSYIFLTNGFDGRLRETTVNHKSVSLAVESLLEGSVSAVMAPRGELQSALASFPEVNGALGMSTLADLFRTDRVRSEWDVGVAALDGNPELVREVEAALQALRDNGTLEQVFADYGIRWVAPGGSGLKAMSGGDGPVGLTRQGLDAEQLCRKHVPAGLL
ncbi:substrate-binding periplasmic protein [Aquisalimonas asiatica]|uniref:Amino acid ABC transporter substrate-binding protein, PAAT family n=1 Tax=Aquisalimonas asiatica TaxID=406100 RepID=A0A1H8S6C3_9GAMM|nr:transporter substrate-binding domain-containing protein [Aquisalimonas asiatica]SEO74087.1 amino acid ABC transporter substrate-binding protein, PAAT family [Aquisalimonas asiatica]